MVGSDRHVLGDNAQTHEYMDLNKSKLTTDLIGFARFIVMSKGTNSLLNRS